MEPTVFAAVATAVAALATTVFRTLLDRRFERAGEDSDRRARELAEAVAAVQERTNRGQIQTRSDTDLVVVGRSADGPSGEPPPLEPSGSYERTWSMVEGLVHEYHRQALDQAKLQFNFSIAAAVVGFLWIVLAGAYGIWGGGVGVDSLISTGPGIVIEAVAALFFRQAQQTRDRATEFYDKLRKDTTARHAIVLINEIEDPSLRNYVKAQVALHMAELYQQASDLGALAKEAGRRLLTIPPKRPSESRATEATASVADDLEDAEDDERDSA